MLVANSEQTFSLISFAISASTYRMSRRPKQPRQGQREKSILDIEVLSRKCVSYEVQKNFQPKRHVSLIVSTYLTLASSSSARSKIICRHSFSINSWTCKTPMMQGRFFNVRLLVLQSLERMEIEAKKFSCKAHFSILQSCG